MSSKIRYIIIIIISRLPLNIFRVFFYNFIFGYKIKKSKIGYGTILDVQDAFILKSDIGKFNRFTGPMKVEIDEYSRIGGSNIFNCGTWTSENNDEYKRYLKIGKNTLITGKHYFDVAGMFYLSDNSWIAGRDSQFWTHGGGIKDKDIIIGRNCYIGSAVRFSPGSKIGNNVLVGLGSVITKKIINDFVIIAGVPGRIVKEKYDWKKKEFIL